MTETTNQHAAADVPFTGSSGKKIALLIFTLLLASPAEAQQLPDYGMQLVQRAKTRPALDQPRLIRPPRPPATNSLPDYGGQFIQKHRAAVQPASPRPMDYSRLSWLREQAHEAGMRARNASRIVRDHAVREMVWPRQRRTTHITIIEMGGGVTFVTDGVDSTVIHRYGRR